MDTILNSPQMIPSIITMLLVLIGLVPAWAAWQKTRWVGKQQVEVAEQAAAIAEAQRQQAEDQSATAHILAEMAKDQAAAKMAQETIALATAQLARDTMKNAEIQAATGAKVDGQMSALHAVIEDLRNKVGAGDLALITEKDKAAALALQAAKDSAEAEAKLLAAKQLPAPPVAVANDGDTDTEALPGGLQVVVPKMTLPVQTTPTSTPPG